MKNNRATLILVLIAAILVGMMGCIASAENTTTTNVTASAVSDATIDLVCGMTVDPKTAEFSTTFEGKTYYFCSAMCKDQFDADPSNVLEAAGSGMVIDPVCLMKVSPDTAEGNSTFNGTEYFFCSPDCKIAFDATPEKFLDSSDSTLVADPVCGMNVDSAVSVSSTYKGTEYFFCCSKCKAKFEKDPEKYLTVVDETSAVDQVCNMKVDPKTADSTEYNGKMYYFCSAMCKEEFVKDPKSFLMK